MKASLTINEVKISKIGENRNGTRETEMDLAEIVIVNRATSSREDSDFFDYVKARWDL